MNNFLTEFEKTVCELRNSGGTIQTDEAITQLLSAMPESYNGVTTAIDVLFCQDENRVTLDFVKNKLLMEESRKNKCKVVKDSVSENAFGVYWKNEGRYGKKNTGHRKVRQNYTNTEGEFRFRCYQCGNKGHKRADCRKNESRRANAAEKQDSEEEQGVAFVTSNNMECQKETNRCTIPFVIDSGATNRLITEKYGRYLTNTKKEEHKINVAKVNESIMSVKQGKLKANTKHGQSVTMYNVLECKNLSHNLMSVRRLEENGLQIVFESKIVKIKKKSKVVAEGYLNGNLYVLELYVEDIQANLVKNEKNLMHRRMGHSSKYPSDEFCKTCVEAKQCRNPFLTLPEERKARRILEVISSDVCGPITPPTHNGKRYFVTFINHFSHFSVCYLLKKKSEVLEKFKEYVSLVESKFNRKIERIRTDNGKEYSSTEFQVFCKSKGIKIQYTCPRNPEQNGIAERYNRTVMEKGRCLIFDSTLGKEFWEEAVSTAVYLINRTETRTL